MNIEKITIEGEGEDSMRIIGVIHNIIDWQIIFAVLFLMGMLVVADWLIRYLERKG